MKKIIFLTIKKLSIIFIMGVNVFLTMYLGLKLVDFSTLSVPANDLGVFMNFIYLFMAILIFGNIFFSSLIFWGYLKLFKYRVTYTNILIIININLFLSIIFRFFFMDSFGIEIYNFLVPLLITNIYLNRKLDKKFIFITGMYYLLNVLIVFLMEAIQ